MLLIFIDKSHARFEISINPFIRVIITLDISFTFYNIKIFLSHFLSH